MKLDKCIIRAYANMNINDKCKFNYILRSYNQLLGFYGITPILDITHNIETKMDDFYIDGDIQNLLLPFEICIVFKNDYIFFKNTAFLFNRSMLSNVTGICIYDNCMSFFDGLALCNIILKKLKNTMKNGHLSSKKFSMLQKCIFDFQNDGYGYIIDLLGLSSFMNGCSFHIMDTFIYNYYKDINTRITCIMHHLDDKDLVYITHKFMLL